MLRTNSPAHTYSVVARDAETGNLGVAVQSHWFSVGSAVPWTEPGVGAVATQSFVDISYGPCGLKLMRSGRSASAALKARVAVDGGRHWRQVAMIDSHGVVAAHTGEKCVPFAGHIIGDGWSVQANMMVNAKVVPAMAKTMARSHGDIAERLIHTLESAQSAGGDIRGAQSAAISVVAGRRSQKSWEGRLIELRIEDHRNPVTELRRLLTMRRAYSRMSLGIEAMLAADFDIAVRESSASRSLLKGNVELRFWNAITRVRSGDFDGAVPDLRSVFAADCHWRKFYSRLSVAGLLSRTEVTKVLALVDKSSA